MNHIYFTSFAVTAMASLVLAQGGDAVPSTAALDRAETPVAQSVPVPMQAPIQNMDLDAFYTPVHTAAADEVGGAYGLWAAGHRYKVSFHDGMTFYPVLGEAYPENLPLRWTTTSVRIGAAELTTGKVETRQAEWRFEYDHGAVVEAYDVLREGVEQTFVIGKPLGSGDLVVQGRVETPLHAAGQAAAASSITFTDSTGNAIVDYGAAFAFDAAGRKTSMTTALEDGVITLRLDAGWLANATYPVTVDPLLSAVIVATHTTAVASRPDIARDDLANELMVTYGRAVSASDYDMWARITDDDLTNTTMVFTDLNTAWSTRNADCAYVGGPDKWCVVMEREFPATSSSRSAIRVHVHDSGDRSLLTSVTFLPSPVGEHHTLPDVGGTDAFSSGNDALIVFQLDLTTSLQNTANSEVYGILFDTSNSTAGTKFLLNPGGGVTQGGNDFDRERPAVNQTSDGGTAPWIVCYQQYNANLASDDWDVIVAQIEPAGTIAGSNFLGQSSATVHSINVKVAGRGGRYMGLYGEEPNSGTKLGGGWASTIKVHRFDWDNGASTPSKLAIGTVRSSSSTNWWNGDMAYDNITDSHWCATYHSNTFNVYTARVGFDSGIAEAATVYSGSANGFSPGVVFNDDDRNFAIVWSDRTTNFPVRGRLSYRAAQSVRYGTACGAGFMTYAGVPHAGSEFYQVRLTSAPSNQFAALMFSFGSGSTPLTSLGMTGCTGYLNPALVLGSYSVITSSGGQAAIGIELPSWLASSNLNLYCQWFYLNPGANPLGAQASRGMRIEIR